MFRHRSHRPLRALCPLLALLAQGRPAPAQQTPPPTAPPPVAPGGEAEWNDGRALALVDRAIKARRRLGADSALHSFEARAEGHVYFLGEFAGRSRLVRADQIALRIRWQAPGRSTQTIVGRRHETLLPTRIRYHIDHLGVVLDNFADRIRLGEGDEVRHVLHPAAPGAPGTYDYRLVDSLEIRIGTRPVRLYRLEVRPARPREPAFVGTLYVERGSGAIARLAGTFTSSAYIDPDLDYIQLDLRSALWNGRYWLPAEQELEIRRQISWLDYPVGGVIRTRFRIFDYELNVELPRLPPGNRIVSLPPEPLAAYPAWEAPLKAGPAVGAEPAEELAALRRQARELVRAELLAGTSRWQLHLPDASGLARARRAEGLLLGAGVRYRLGGPVSGSVWGGWAFARERPELQADLVLGTGRARLRVAGFANRLADAGSWPAASGLVATAGFATRGKDWTDPYFEHGGELAVSLPLAGGRSELHLLLARQTSAALVASGLGSASTRAIRSIREGTLGEAGLTQRWSFGTAPGVRGSAELALAGAVDGIGEFGHTRAIAALEAEGDPAASAWSWSVRFAGGVAGGALPPQRLLLLGGRGTVPGYPFRAWAGDRAVWGGAEAARDLVAPWLRLRLGAAAGWTGLAGPGREAATSFGAIASGGVRPALGFGAGLFWDILRLDLFRGLEGGSWTFQVSLDPDYRDIL